MSGTTQAVDASGQESTLLTVPSNAPYITYTDADGQVYRREEDEEECRFLDKYLHV